MEFIYFIIIIIQGGGRRPQHGLNNECHVLQEEDEMRQLLESISLISEAQAAGGDFHFESHIIFDNGVRQKELSEFALVLIALLDETLGEEGGLVVPLLACGSAFW